MSAKKAPVLKRNTKIGHHSSKGDISTRSYCKNNDKYLIEKIGQVAWFLKRTRYEGLEFLLFGKRDFSSDGERTGRRDGVVWWHLAVHVFEVEFQTLFSRF